MKLSVPAPFFLPKDESTVGSPLNVFAVIPGANRLAYLIEKTWFGLRRLTVSPVTFVGDARTGLHDWGSRDGPTIQLGQTDSKRTGVMLGYPSAVLAPCVGNRSLRCLFADDNTRFVLLAHANSIRNDSSLAHKLARL